MAVAITKVLGADHVCGNRKVKVRDLVFSGNYATGGESLTAAQVGLRKIDTVVFSGPMRATDAATAVTQTYDYTNSKVISYESGADGVALAEKTNSEAYPTGANVRAIFTGV